MIESLSSLTGDERAVLGRRLRSVLQFHRDLAPPAVRKAAKWTRARDGVRPELDRAAQSGPSHFEATVDDGEEPERVVLRLDDPGSVRCGCATVKRLGTCHHTLAVLEHLFTEAYRKPETDAPAVTQGATYLDRLEALGARLTKDRARIDRGRTGDPWADAARGTADVRYVLRHVRRGDASGFRLEAQVRVQNAGGSKREWRAVPITVEATSEEAALGEFGPEHAAVAAIAGGTPDAERAPGADFGRTVGLARVDRVIAPMILRAAERAGSLLVRTRDETSARMLSLDLVGVARLEISIESKKRSQWTLRAIVAGPSEGASAELRDVLAVTSDGLVVLREGDDDARLVAFDAPGARHVIEEFARAPLVVPADDSAALAAIGGVATFADDALRRAACPIEPRACLRFEAPLDASGDAPAARDAATVRTASSPAAVMNCFLDFDYGGTRVTFESADEVVACMNGSSAPRQRGFEKAALTRFFELGGRRTHAHRRTDHDATVAATKFEGMVATLVDEGWTVVAEDRLVRPMSHVDITISSGVDWFDLVGGPEFDGKVVPWPEVLRAANEGRRYVELGDGSRGLLPQAWLERWRLAALADIEEEGEGLRFDQSHAWLLAALVEEADARVDDPFAELRASLAHLGTPKPVRAPDAFTGSLRAYQEEGLGWLQLLDRVGLSGCLADDMGLGKTVQILAYFLHRARSNDGRPSLVVAPKSLVFNWIAEARRFAPTLACIDFSGSGRWNRFREAPEGALFVTTYGALRRDALKLVDTEFDVVVLDEAQAIKSRASQTTKAARALRARRRVSLTGTPIENHLGDLWSQLEFLNPGMLGASPSFDRLGAPRAQAELVDDGKELLSKALRPILLRRTKDAVLTELPPKTEQVLRAPLTGAQRAAYDEMAAYYRAELSLSKKDKKDARAKDPGRAELNVLAALTRLRQCACHPGLVDKSLIAERSGKLDLVLPMLEEIVAAGGKAIVFSSFTGLLALVRTHLETARVPYAMLEGATRDRGSLVDRFQGAEGGMIFLISIKAGGAGLNLTAADYVFLLDPWWNPAVEAQAIDRAHRMGRERPVHVYRVLTEETVEARVVELQQNKRALSDDVLNSATRSVQDIGAADLAFLLS